MNIDSGKTTTASGTNEAKTAEALDSAVRQAFGDCAEDVLLPIGDAMHTMENTMELLKSIRIETMTQSLDIARIGRLSDMAEQMMVECVDRLGSMKRGYAKQMHKVGIISDDVAANCYGIEVESA